MNGCFRCHHCHSSSAKFLLNSTPLCSNITISISISIYVQTTANAMRMLDRLRSYRKIISHSQHSNVIQYTNPTRDENTLNSFNLKWANLKWHIREMSLILPRARICATYIRNQFIYQLNWHFWFIGFKTHICESFTW